MVLKIKTLIMTEKPIFDIRDQYLPKGFYYFDIKKFTQYNTTIGYIISDNIFNIYEFKMFTVIKLMAKAISKLSRQTGLQYNITNFNSPSNSPIRQPKSLSCSYLPYLNSTNENATNVKISSNIPNNSIFNNNKLKKITERKKHVNKKNDKKYEECSICLEECKRNRYRLRCKHTFHKKCIKEWFKTKKNCPNCRTKLPHIKL